MRKLTLVSVIFFILFVQSNTVQAEDNLSVSYSPTNITQAMDLSMQKNSLSYLYAQGSSRVDSSYKEYAGPDSLKLKNPNAALFYALVPGFVVHGAGHFYAGKTKTGVILLSMGTAGGVMVIGGGIGAAFATSGVSTRGQIVIATGAILFIGSWLYDVFVAPKVVEKEREQFFQGGKK